MSREVIHSHIHDIARGLIGTLATLGSVAIGRLAEVKAWLEVASLGMGFLVGVATFWSIISRNRREARAAAARELNKYPTTS